MIPKKIFFVKGEGKHKDKLVSFEMALRAAGIEAFNLVYVSSIYPPGCATVAPDDGLSLLSPGQIVHCVMAKSETDMAGQNIASAIGLAVPENRETYGYIAEFHGEATNADEAGRIGEQLALTMLDTARGEGIASKEAIEKFSIAEAGSGKDGLWTTVVAAAVMVMD